MRTKDRERVEELRKRDPHAASKLKRELKRERLMKRRKRGF
jgi:hypothetical protein